MSTFSSKFNKTNFGIDTTEFKYAKLSDLYASPDVIRKINGMWVHKSPLGATPVFVVADEKILVNVPSHLTETVSEILSDEQAVNDIKNGKVGFTIYTYTSHGKTCYSVNFVDL